MTRRFFFDEDDRLDDRLDYRLLTTDHRRLFFFLYGASGAAALVYEVAWTRLLTLQLGHTVAAASTVLAAFMGGLAIGAWLAGSFDPIAANWLAGDTGLLYAANTAGAALGAIAAGFWLIPTLGLRGTTWIGVLLNVVAAGGALWLATKSVTAEHTERAERKPLKKKQK